MNRRKLGTLLVGSALSSTTLAAFADALADPAKPRFSVMLWTLAKRASFDRSLEIVAAAGYQGVELVGEFQRWDPEQTRQNLARLRSLGLEVDSMSGVKAGFAVPADTPAFLAQLEAHLHSAQELGCPQIILLSGPGVPTISPEAQRQVAIDNLLHAADLAGKAQIEIVIEPIDPLENPTIFLQTVSDGFKIVRSVNRPNVKVLYDFYHEQRSFGNLLEKLETNIDWIGLVHVADVPGRHEPGTGEIDYPNLYRKLAQWNYRRWIAMEFYPTEDPTLALRHARETALRAFL